MKLKELCEGVIPKLAGAPAGVKVMSLDQFMSQVDEDPVDEVDKASKKQAHFVPGKQVDESNLWAGRGFDIRSDHLWPAKIFESTAPGEEFTQWLDKYKTQIKTPKANSNCMLVMVNKTDAALNIFYGPAVYVDEDQSHYLLKIKSGTHRYSKNKQLVFGSSKEFDHFKTLVKLKFSDQDLSFEKMPVMESVLNDATELPAQQRDLKGSELTDYFDRIRGTPKLDKNGNRTYMKDRVSKKTGEVTPGDEKYVSGKTKTDKYKLPYIHRSSVLSYYDEAGKTYNVDAIKQAFAQRPKKLLKQNEKMKHSNGAYEQFFNIGFAALTGFALDENTNELIVVNTCPGAGSCKVDCFAMKGGKVQFAGPWVSDGRILTYLLNDPNGFKNQLKNEINQEYQEGQRGSKGFEDGWEVTVRWHDAGDFFSPEYMDLAFDIARSFPGVKFYAYTKMAGAVLANKPSNFIVNWSEGATTSQEKQVKATDQSLSKTKNSRIVPEKLFYDLLKKDERGNPDKEGADAKGGGGRWQMRDPGALRELKQRLAKEYNLSAHSILSYDEWMSKPHGNGMMWNVIVAPGEGDVSANSHDVLSTLLLRH